MWMSGGQTGQKGGGKKYREQINQNGLGCRSRNNLPLFRKPAGLSSFLRSFESPETLGFGKNPCLPGKTKTVQNQEQTDKVCASHQLRRAMSARFRSLSFSPIRIPVVTFVNL